ncbi:MAG: hypothetical protein M3017_06405 [Actinomycetota bacterium]|nr:hypothetical protein [Actinomycetota bacterium]
MDWFVWLIWILVIILIIFLIRRYVRARSQAASGGDAAGPGGARPAAQHMPGGTEGTGSPQHYVDSTSAEASGHTTSVSDLTNEARYDEDGNYSPSYEAAGGQEPSDPGGGSAERGETPQVAALTHMPHGVTAGESAVDEALGSSSDQPAATTAPRFAPGAAPFGPDSAAPGADGAAPAGFMIKATAEPLAYYGPDSPDYHEITADIWFRTYDAAEAAGFRRANR